MHWPEALDVSLFRFINLRLSNPLFDAIMPFFSGNPVFFPLLVGGAGLLLWKGRTRGIVCVLMLALIVSLGDGMVCRTMKNAIARERPCIALPETHCLIGKSHSGSMPSSHAA